MSKKGYADLLNELQVKLSTGNFTDWIGFLDQEKADEFIDLTIDQSALLKAATVERVDERAGEFYTMDLPYPVTRGRWGAAGMTGPIPYQAQPDGYNAPYENVEWSTETGTYAVGKFTYSCNKIVTYFEMSWEQINWNIEGPDFEDKLVRDWSKCLRRDLELLAIRGDKDVTLTNGFPEDYWRELYRIDDGWIKQILNINLTGHVIDWVQNSVPQPVDHTLWQKMRVALPTRWVDDNLYWIVSPRIIADYQHYLADRGDALGAAMLMGSGQLRPEGIPILNDYRGVPYMPEVASGSDTLTNVVLCNPQKLWVVIHRDFRLESERQPKLDNWYWIGHGYVDFIVPFPDAIVIAKNVKYAA